MPFRKKNVYIEFPKFLFDVHIVYSQKPSAGRVLDRAQINKSRCQCVLMRKLTTWSRREGQLSCTLRRLLKEVDIL